MGRCTWDLASLFLIQARAIMDAGLRGFRNKLARSQVHRPISTIQHNRELRRILEKSTWFMPKEREDEEEAAPPPPRRRSGELHKGPGRHHRAPGPHQSHQSPLCSFQGRKME